MANVKNEKYGIASCNAEVDALKRMGVQERNIYWTGNCNGLFQRISFGDVLCVCNVKSFAVGAYELYNRLEYLKMRGIEFRSLNEKFLNFSSAKPLPKTTVQVLGNLASREHEFVLWIYNGAVSKDVKNQLISRVRWEFLTNVVLMFSSNGVKHRN